MSERDTMSARSTFAITSRCRTGALLALALVAPAAAQVTTRVSVGYGGVQATGGSSQLNAISTDGRCVAFHSEATNLVSGDTNGFGDIFVHDRLLGTTEIVSIAPGGALGNGTSTEPDISADGRYVVFHSSASNLVVGDTNGAPDVFVHDRQLGTNERVSVDSSGAQSNGQSLSPCVSGDGRYTAFYSIATNLVAGDTNGIADVFVHDRQLGTTERVSVSIGGAQGNAASFHPRLSYDGRYVAFHSSATNLVAGDVNGFPDVFVRDRQLGTTELVSLSSGGAQGNFSSNVGGISDDGRYVAFSSGASNLVAGDTNAVNDVFLRDRQAGTTERVSISSGGAQANGSTGSSDISADGRFVAFDGGASNLVPGDTNGDSDVFVRDVQLATTTRASVNTNGGEGNNTSVFATLSGDGHYVAFDSVATNFVDIDNNGFADVFVHDRAYAPMTSLCDPGAAGVITCPCANPPSGSGRGCNNSSNTGGAILSATGHAFVSADTLVFTTSGEKPTAFSIVAQWTGTNPAGIVFGMGVRCTAGSLKRLYTKSAVGGSITAPDFGAGDPQVSARSAVLGDTITPGQNRWYLVYYRDPNVLGGCPPTGTFNATQTGKVVWMP